MPKQDNNGKVWPPYMTNEPPDIDHNTRIIGLLGTRMSYPEGWTPLGASMPLPTAAPHSEGRFLSDFCLFWWLCRNTTKHQTWLHCLDIPELLRAGYQYSHGNPFSNNRKVVLNDDLYDQMMKDMQSPEFVPKQLLLEHFLDTLQREHLEAKANNQKLLILIFTNGDVPSVLNLPRADPCMRPSSENSIMLQVGKTLRAGSKKVAKKRSEGLVRADFDRVIDGTVDVSFFTSACFSGGWISQKYVPLNVIGTSVAEVDELAAIWTRAGSRTNRCAASMWVIVLARYLTMDFSTMQSPFDTDYWWEQEYFPKKAFMIALDESLLEDIDHGGYAHQITFSVIHHDESDEPWKQRTGLPVEAFEQNFSKLPVAERDMSLHPGDPRNRSPEVTEAQREDYNFQCAIATPVPTEEEDYEDEEDEEAYEVDEELETDDEEKLETDDEEDLIKCRAREKFRFFASAFGNGPEDEIGAVHRLAPMWREAFPGSPGFDAPRHTGIYHDGTHDDHMWDYLYAVDRMWGEGWKHHDRIDLTYNALCYRFAQMQHADCYVRFLGIPYPNGQQCAKFNIPWYASHHWKSERWQAIWAKLYDCPMSDLFPSPRASGAWACKGRDYLTSALHKSDLTSEEINLAIEKLHSCNRKHIERAVAIIRKDPKVAKALEDFYEAIKTPLPRPDGSGD